MSRSENGHSLIIDRRTFPFLTFTRDARSCTAVVVVSVSQADFGMNCCCFSRIIVPFFSYLMGLTSYSEIN